MNLGPFFYFNIFAFLIAGRDVASQILLSEKIDPVFMLAIYCWTTTVAAFATNIMWREGSILRIISTKKIGTNFFEFSKPATTLGIYTLLAFLATLFGIKLIGAPIFNLVEHALMPISTAFLAGKIFGDHLSRLMRIGLALCILGVFFTVGPEIFLVENDRGRSLLFTFAGLFLAVGASVLTSLTSANQKKLVSNNLTPDEVLFIRFLVPSIILILFFPFMTIPDISLILIAKLVGVALVGFALPLVFLCLGFLKASLARFSAYLLLIPAYTFFLGTLLIQGEAEKLKDPFILSGIALILCGYITFEWPTFKAVLGLKNFSFTKTKGQ